MGVVWAGHDELLDRSVAIKEVTFPRGIDEQERAVLRARTMREARTAARIWAGGSVAIYDVVEEDDRPWIVMELLPSRTLQDEVAARGPLPPREVAQIGLGLLAGLSAAHAAGILHRDVKPGNVMFREGPRGRSAVLGDFGIAHFDGDPTLTSTGLMIGSPAYVAPERAHGRPASVASDLWSLGVTLWTAVEGRSPYLRENALATLTAVITEEVPPAVHAGPLRPVLEGLLRKDPGQRLDAAGARRILTSITNARPAAPVVAEDRTRVMTPVPPPAPAGRATPAHVATLPQGASARAASAAPVATPRRRRRLAPVFLGLAVPVIIGVGALLQQETDPSGTAGQTSADGSSVQGRTLPSPPETPQQTPQQTPEPTAAETAAPDPAAPPPVVPPQEAAPPQEPAPVEPAPGAVEGSEQSAAQVTVPEGFETYSDTTGFSVAVPAGWQPERDGPRVYLHDPDSSAYLLVDQTDQPAPDPVADWQQQEPAVAERLDGYQRIGEIRPVDFRGWQAADWEFVFGAEQQTHVLNRNVVTSPSQAYALYWSVPSSRWDELLPVHEQVVASFQPAG